MSTGAGGAARSGWPAEGVLTATVLAPTAAEADALATAFYVMGPQAAGEYCRNHEHVAAVIICPGKHVASVEIHRFGLGQRDWTPLGDA